MDECTAIRIKRRLGLVGLLALGATGEHECSGLRSLDRQNQVRKILNQEYEGLNDLEIIKGDRDGDGTFSSNERRALDDYIKNCWSHQSREERERATLEEYFKKSMEEINCKKKKLLEYRAREDPSLSQMNR